MSMFRAKDAKNIRAIQDVLECCGFNSVRDRAYPFGQPSACAETYGRTQSCAQAWKGAMQTSAGIDFGVVLAVAILQVSLPFLLLCRGKNKKFRAPGKKVLI
jgi:hypothetical protein